ncbi:MAG: alkaline phosphatase D family protein [bacterium]
MFALLAACQPQAGAPNLAPPMLSLGTAVGEVTASSVVVWGRCDRPGTLHVRITPGERSLDAEALAAHDGTARVLIDNLRAAQAYTYRAWCSAGGVNDDGAVTSRSGAFRTAPAPDVSVSARIIWSGDLGGQNVCRDATLGYPIFASLLARKPDLFVALGDMIYADDPCTATGRYGNAQIVGPPPATDRAGFWAHWRYNRADPGQQALLGAVPMAAVWDDHEIANDAGPHQDTPAFANGAHLLPPALQAFLDYQPMLPPADDPTRLYRSLRWGKQLELFILDLRQYRDANASADSDAAPKSMLGAAQRAWLEQALIASDATWKVIVASVPLSIPTGAADGRGGFASGGDATGFAHEAASIFETLRAHGIRNHLWITTDVHFATGFVYRPSRADPSFLSREIITGPLNAGVFPTEAVDPTFSPERLFYYAPPSADAITSFSEAQDWFNFGLLEIFDNGRLAIGIFNGRGQAVYRTTLQPET